MGKIKVGKCDIFEQLGRIPIAGSCMYVVWLLQLSNIGEFFSMICLLIWMILPTIKMFKIEEVSSKA